MNGSRIAKCMFCRILHSVSLNRRIHSIHRLRLVQASIYKSYGVSFTTYQKLLKQNDDVDSGSSSSDSDSSDSDSDNEQLNTTRTKADDLLSKLQKTESIEEKRAEKHSAKKSENSSSEMSDLFELLKKNEKKITPGTSTKSNQYKKITEMVKDSIDTELVSEAQNLSKVLPGNSQENESKLLGQLLQQFNTTAKQKSGEALKKKDTPKTSQQSLKNVMEGLTVQKKTEDSYGDGFDRIREKQPTFRPSGIGLFTGKPLGIFSKEYMETAKKDKESLFEVLAEEERSLAKFYPAENAFEEHIQWTREGRMWTFPIDNEAGWEEEKNTSFEDHIFLQNKLDGFPKKGPIRHFMELVCVSLSKNPYLSAAQKQEHLEWYRNYFHEKQDMLEERLGADGVVNPKESLNK